MAISKEVMFGAMFLVVSAVINSSSGSAIPMWEYLSKGEKMSHLYSMFAKQVNSHCKTTTTDRSMKPQCKRELLTYGLGKLQSMTETHLDAMDPYQRGATDIIWDSMMDGHPSMSNKKDSTTVEPIREPSGDYSRNPIFDNDKSEPQSHKPASHDNYAMGMDMDVMYGQYQLPRDEDNLYSEPQNHLQAPTNVNEQYLHPNGLDKGYLSGPMMVMVRPDGTPVDKYLPKDDDREAMTIGKEGLPTVEQIATHFGTTKNKLDENQEITTSRNQQNNYGYYTNQQLQQQQQQQQRAFYYHNNNFRTFTQRLNTNHH